MARDAMGKLEEAKQIDKLADALKKRDPISAMKLQGLAKRKRSSAIRQMSRRPGGKKKEKLTISG